MRAFRVVVLVTILSCGGDRAPVDSTAAVAPDTTRASAALDSAARRIVGFLQGTLPYDSIQLADSVQLRVSPEGGGDRTVVPREQLRDRSRWVVKVGRATYPLAPRPGRTKLTTRVGRHFNCMEYELSTRAPELARAPHVGAKLEPQDGDSCLQTWNMTFVFDTTAGRPRLVAALYDQWEW